MFRHFTMAAVCAVVLFAAGQNRAADPGIEFFEKKIRPILVESCYECHSGGAESVKGGLKLDSRTAILKGGDSGPAVVSGKPKESLLMEAVRYTNSELKMPPKGKLPDTAIVDLEEWIAMGAPMSAAAPQVAAKAPPSVEAGRRFWSFQPPRRSPIPAVPVADFDQPADHVHSC